MGLFRYAPLLCGAVFALACGQTHADEATAASGGATASSAGTNSGGANSAGGSGAGTSGGGGQTALPPHCVAPLEFADPAVAAKVQEHGDVSTVTLLDVTAPVTSLAGVECLPNLQIVFLTGGGSFSDLSPLAGLQQLIGVDLYGTYPALSDLSPLASLVQLTGIELDGSAVANLSPLRSLTKLTSLSLISSQIADVSPLSSLTSLKTLSLFNNQIEDVSALAALPALTELNLSNNQIYDTAPLVLLKTVIKLDLNHNGISDLAPLAADFCLTGPNLPKEPNCTLDLRNNPIDCPSQAMHLATLRSHPIDLMSNCPP
jgi:Leucine-rich repeat (LRR) protein